VGATVSQKRTNLEAQATQIADFSRARQISFLNRNRQPSRFIQASVARAVGGAAVSDDRMASLVFSNNLSNSAGAEPATRSSEDFFKGRREHRARSVRAACGLCSLSGSSLPPKDPKDQSRCAVLPARRKN
jgi:hypothetical protein